jgi:hypothetical protein
VFALHMPCARRREQMGLFDLIKSFDLTKACRVHCAEDLFEAGVT